MSNNTLSDADATALRTYQSDHQPTPLTIAAAATIAPVAFLTFVSGTTNIATITAPVNGVTMIALVFTNGSPGQLTTTGNIKLGTTNIVQNVPVICIYNPVDTKWYVGNLKV